MRLKSCHPYHLTPSEDNSLISLLAKMIYLVGSPQFQAFLHNGQMTPTTDQVCDALEEIKKNYPKLEATQMAAMLRQTKPHWILDNLNWVELQERLDTDSD